MISDDDARVYRFQRNMVVAASAGTGKTHRLTSLFALVCLGLTSRGQRDRRDATAPSTPDRVWATTYTRAAAREIEGRTARLLEAVARGSVRADAAPFADVLEARRAELDAPPSESDLRTRAEHALATLSLARVDTLHGLASRLLRGAGSGALADARVLEPAEHAALEGRAIDEALEAALAPGHALQPAARFALDAAGNLSALREYVSKLFERLDEEGLEPGELELPDHATTARALAALVRDVALAAAAEDKTDVATKARELARLVEGVTAAGAPAVALAARERRAIAELARAVFEFRLPKAGPLRDAVTALRAAQRGETNAKRAAGFASFVVTAPVLAEREEGVRALLQDARERARASRARERAVSFGDLLRKTRDLLRDDRAFAARAREGHDVLLVDEFQDTSAVQRDVVYLLRERGDRAEARRAGDLPRAGDLEAQGLFLVGDRKQAIYGFRGADVSVFCEVCAELAGAPACEALAIAPPAEPQLGPGGLPVADFVALRESRRSATRVIDFVNAFCARDFGAPTGRSFEAPYTAAEALMPAPGAPEGSVRFVGRAWSAAAGVETDAGADARDRDPEADGAGAGGPAAADDPRPSARDAELAAATVAAAIAGGARPSEFAVLARTRATLPFVELALARANVPYVVAGRAFFHTREVRDCAAILRLLLEPRDKLALATVLRGPAACLSDASLVLLANHAKGLLVPLEAANRARAGAQDPDVIAYRENAARLAPDERERLEHFRERFAGLSATAHRMSGAEALRLAVRELDLDSMLAALPHAPARVGNLDRLVALASARGGSLASFSRFLDRCIDDEVVAEEAAAFEAHDDAVALMTMHASKGLDFERVVLVDWGKSPQARLPPIDLLKRADGRGAPRLIVKHVVARADADPAAEAIGLPAPRVALATPANLEAQSLAIARELAERRRLTYVALTRAKAEVVVVVPAGKPRTGSAHATLEEGATQPDLEPFTRDARADVAPAPPAAPPAPEASHAAPAPSAFVAPSARASSIAIATTPLFLFKTCARRYRLRMLLGIEEGETAAPAAQLSLFGASAPGGNASGALEPLGPFEPFDPGAGLDPSDDARPATEFLVTDDVASASADDAVTDPRALGTAAHRVLERLPRELFGAPGPATSADAMRARLVREGMSVEAPETARIGAALSAWVRGPYAARLATASSARLLREEAFVLRVDAREHASPPLRLRGAIDLVVARGSGPVDVLDYKLAPSQSSLESYAFQLRAYALVAHRRFPGRVIRAGVVFLGASAPTEPVFLSAGDRGARDASLSDDDHERFERDLAALAARFAESRATDAWPGVDPDRCRAAHCGFLKACHPRNRH